LAQGECEKERELEKLFKEIYGNGSEGMKDKLVRVDANLKFNTWLTALVAGGVVSAVIKVFFG
jgi:hypothetical protein